VARVLIVGCGCRGAALARSLLDDGHTVRGTTRRPERAAELMAAGIEPWVGDPDRVGSLVYAQDNVTVLCWLLGRVASPALHGPRLRMMLEKTTDTTVRGVVLEAAGTVAPEALAAGVAEARHARATNEIPYALVEADPADRAAWLRAARRAIDALLTARPAAAA
jgi:NAD(P)-dependent dehydrogenase (short-subunit alcohol dehydrogenase family)